MKRMTGLLLALIVIGLLITPTVSTPAMPAEPASSHVYEQGASSSAEITDFELLAENTGWILLEQALYRTQDGGDNWQAITPDGMQGWILAVDFSDTQAGWLVAVQSASDGSVKLRLERTRDGGKTWYSAALDLFQAGDPAGDAGAIYLDFISPAEGWLVVQRQSSSNFSLGTLFHTVDGGESWTEHHLPFGEPVIFSSEQIGFQVSGAADQFPEADPNALATTDNDYTQFESNNTGLFRTLDGGEGWQPLALLPSSDYDGQNLHYQLPVFRNAKHGLLPAFTSSQVFFFETDDGGLTWSLAAIRAQAVETPELTNIPFTNGAGQSWLAVLPPGVLYQITPSERQALQSSGSLPAAGIYAISAPPSDTQEAPAKALTSIWAAARSGSCLMDANGTPATCRQTHRLLHSQDGGQSWQAIRLPTIESQSNLQLNDDFPPGSVFPAAPPLGAIPQRALSTTGHGFDKCELPGVVNLQEWMANSPYHTVNLYFGGIWRACSNLGITASYLNQLSQLGWKFIPTWVGPQSKCFSSGSSKPRIPDDTSEAYDLGVSEAQAALSLAASLGLAHPDGSGTVLYYDLEAYDVNNSTCVKSAQAFTAGWSGEIQARGSLAGMYSTGRSLDLLDTVQFPPQVIWPANWIYNSYNPNATVWNVFGLSNSLWGDHQRIRQYAGGHDETWGLTTMTIDSNVMDGVVADISCPETLGGGGSGMVLYRDGSLRCGGLLSGAGYFTQASSGWVNLPAGMDNAASSLRLAAGWSLRLFENADRQDGSICLEAGRDSFTGLTFDNGHALDNAASSAWLFDRPGCRDYQDTSPGNAAYNEIESLFLAGYRLGCDENTASFCPDAALTRAQLAQWLETWRNAPDYKAPPAVPPVIFSDVPANGDEATNPWYSAWVHLAWQDQLVEACSPSPLAYCPDQAVKRSEAAQAWLKTLHGATYQPPPASGAVFSDVSAAHPYAAWIEQAWKDGLIDACAAGQFCPDAIYLRSQAAHTLMVADGLKVQEHDPQQNQPPGAISFSSYFGGSNLDTFSGTTFDLSGRQYLAGYSASASLPGSQLPLYGERDAVLTRMQPDGSSPQYSRYLGGSRTDQAVDVAVDSNGYTVVLGITDSTNFSTQNASQAVYQGGRDLFLARFDPNGSLQWSTYLGGSNLEEASRVMVDGVGNIYITGWTASDNFPQPGGTALPSNGIDAFVARINPNGSLAWTELIGGSASDRAWDLSLGTAGDLLIVGDTASTNFPLLNQVPGGPGGGQQVLLVRLSQTNGELLSSSTVGGSRGDFGRGAWLDATGAYASGFSASSDFPLASPLQPALGGGFDSFALQLTPSTGAWVFSSYLGGNGGDFARRVTAYPDGSLWLGGWTTSTDLPGSLYWPRQAGGSSDAYISILSPGDGTIRDNLLLGGTAGERLLGMASAQDGGLYLSGFSHSPNLPVYRPLQAQRAGGLDGLVLRTALQHRVYIPLIRR